MLKKDGSNEIKSTSHSRYRCQYHIVFAPKYRRKEIYGTLKKDIGVILRKLCEQKGVEINITPISFFNVPYISFLLYFGANTM